MNSHFHIPLLLSILVFTITASATKLPIHKDQQINSKEADAKILSSDTFDWQKLIGVEDCGNGDQECLMRRATLEAHLDYIYTQNRAP